MKLRILPREFGEIELPVASVMEAMEKLERFRKEVASDILHWDIVEE